MTANTTHNPSVLDVQIIQGEAPTIYIYRVDAGELQQLTNASSPLPLAIFGIAIGAFFSLLPSVADGLTKFGTESYEKSDLIYALLDVLALFVGIVAGVFAVRNAHSVRTILAAIKSRAT